MCGIIGAVAKREVAPLLLTGLRRLEYRGYDSAGMAIINEQGAVHRLRTLGKVNALATLQETTPLFGHIGIAHTRWATHGKPNQVNAHPHMSGESVALVHNGIIENHEKLRKTLEQKGYDFTSETDTEIIVHLLHYELAQQGNFYQAVQAVVNRLKGAFALAIAWDHEPEHLFVVRRGSPLVIGLGNEENFVASDPVALTLFTDQFIYLEEEDIADIHLAGITIYDGQGKLVERPIQTIQAQRDTVSRGRYRHFMEKEIFEQPETVAATLEGRLTAHGIADLTLGEKKIELLKQTKRIHIVACGTSYYAGLVGSYWLESVAGIPTQVEIASERRYRQRVVEPDTLYIAISQSGETADTLAAIKQAKKQGYFATLVICNVPDSSLVQLGEIVFMTRAGVEIGVASTKAFTAQLTVLLLLTGIFAKYQSIAFSTQAHLLTCLRQLPETLQSVLTLNDNIKTLATRFVDKHHALFLGRGIQYPVAMEGALKLKEISYLHAEAYAAGELKHGPLALVDSDMPVIAVAPNDELLEKLKSNLQEVRARGGELIVFADVNAELVTCEGLTVITMPVVESLLSPIAYVIPLQLLAYYVALHRGTDLDQPRNLAKSVTVE